MSINEMASRLMGTERQVAAARDLPGLELQEIYGIGERMEQRLHRAGIYTVAELWQASPMRLRRVWGGINGLPRPRIPPGIPPPGNAVFTQACEDFGSVDDMMNARPAL